MADPHTTHPITPQGFQLPTSLMKRALQAPTIVPNALISNHNHKSKSSSKPKPLKRLNQSIPSGGLQRFKIKQSRQAYLTNT